mmetsp:Transcript_139717/g.197862  ORF Transcript_139717/g.197862 Transcript_139717/m.197862 type:complete len:214 (-) Transcript_139717:45-686(-)
MVDGYFSTETHADSSPMKASIEDFELKREQTSSTPHDNMKTKMEESESSQEEEQEEEDEEEEEEGEEATKTTSNKKKSSDNMKIKTVNRGRMVGEVLDLVNRWREYHKQFKEEYQKESAAAANGSAKGGKKKTKPAKPLLEMAADRMDVPIKSLKNYLVIIKKCEDQNLDLESLRAERFGYLRRFAALKKPKNSLTNNNRAKRNVTSSSTDEE